MSFMTRVHDVPWANFVDAYGTCNPAVMADVLADLASDDLEKCDAALNGLSSSIFHQDDIYSSTAIALPFLLEIGSTNAQLGDTFYLEFIALLATCAATTPAKIERQWTMRKAQSPMLHRAAVSVLAAPEIKDTKALRSAFVDNAKLLEQVLVRQQDAAPEFAAQLRKKIQKFKRMEQAE